MRSVFILAIIGFSALSPASSLVCKGQVSEFGMLKTIEQTTVLESTGDATRMGEMTFNFKMSSATRLSLQVRALSENGKLNYAATFSEVALQPLGRVENVFYEKLHPDTDGLIGLNKDFTDLKLKLSCQVL